jgi:hypothetical protein
MNSLPMSDGPATFSAVDSQPMDQLSPEEVSALRRAGAWYANYHSARIADLATDGSAYAERKREDFLVLIEALHKLGSEMALPDALRSPRAQAA